MISRRTFLLQSAGAVATVSALGVRPGAGAEPPAAAPKIPPPVPPRSAVYARSLVIDTLSPDGPFFDAQEAVKAGITAAVADLAIYPRSFPQAVEGLADWSNVFHQPDSGFLKVLKAADLREAKRLSKLGIILACQDAAILDASTGSVNDHNLRNLRFFHDLGLRVLQLTHNDRNPVGDSFREKSDAGLSRLGEKVVPEMNALGMLVDLSHCSDKTTLESIRLSTKPCAVTHAGCRALYPTLRNKPDEVIRALAEKGGYFGIYNMSVWLTDRDTTSVSDVVDHIDHVVKLGGIDLPGFGSDGPILGDSTPQEQKVKGMVGYYKRNQGLPGAEREPKHVTVTALDSPHRLQVLADSLGQRGYKDGDVEKILGGNFARVFAAVCG
ncbi:MAG TPA: membrane dipeptidase [Thermoanaerobaculia bacterium]|nr:membrane dipeptidase [Thermoanaerobaculia bacterium]